MGIRLISEGDFHIKTPPGMFSDGVLSLFPGGWCKQQQHREQLQSAGKHIEYKNDFRRV